MVRFKNDYLLFRGEVYTGVPSSCATAGSYYEERPFSVASSHSYVEMGDGHGSTTARVGDRDRPDVQGLGRTGHQHGGGAHEGPSSTPEVVDGARDGHYDTPRVHYHVRPDHQDQDRADLSSTPLVSFGARSGRHDRPGVEDLRHADQEVAAGPLPELSTNPFLHNASRPVGPEREDGLVSSVGTPLSRSVARGHNGMAVVQNITKLAAGGSSGGANTDDIETIRRSPEHREFVRYTVNLGKLRKYRWRQERVEDVWDLRHDRSTPLYPENQYMPSSSVSGSSSTGNDKYTCSLSILDSIYFRMMKGWSILLILQDIWCEIVFFKCVM